MPYGIEGDIAIGFQTSWDNQVTDVGSFNFLPFIDESVTPTIEDLVSENMRGVFDEGDSYQGKKSAGGDLQAECQPIAIGWMLKSFFGAASTSAVGSAFSHEFEPRQSDWDAKSAQDPITYYKHMGDTGSASLLYNANVSGIEFSLANGELLKVKLTILGGEEQQVAALTAPALETGKRWTWDTASFSLAGVANDDIEDMTITLEDGLEAVHTTNGSKWPAKIKRGGASRTVTVAGTLCFEDQTEYQNFLASTEQAFVLTLTGTVEVGSGYYDTLTFEFPKLRYTEFPLALAGPGRQTVSFSAKAKYWVDSGTSTKITLVNTQSAY